MGNCLQFDALHDFFVWPRTVSNPPDVNRFLSHAGITHSISFVLKGLDVCEIISFNLGMWEWSGKREITQPPAPSNNTQIQNKQNQDAGIVRFWLSINYRISCNSDYARIRASFKHLPDVLSCYFILNFELIKTFDDILSIKFCLF